MLVRRRRDVGQDLLNRLGLRRSLAALIVALGIVALQAAPAHADVTNGFCDLNMRFAFPATKPTLTGAAAPYTFGLLPGSSCTLQDLSRTPSVTMTGSAAAGEGGITLARCGVLAGNGEFNQAWGGEIPLVDNGTHVVVGTWLHATMVVTAFPPDPIRMTGVIELVPLDLVATLQAIQTCLNNGNVPEIRMRGVEVFNDPILP